MTSIIKKKYVDNQMIFEPSYTIFAGSKKLIFTMVISLALIACEAPLNLDGVESEKQKQVRRTDQLQGIAANRTHVVVVGSDGVILTSPVGQLLWGRQQLESTPALIDVAACPDQSFVALSLDKKIWYSDDNGVRWRAKQLPTTEDVLGLTCAPNNSVWVVGGFSTVLSSSNKGDQWAEVTMNEDVMLTGIQFIDEKTAFISGEFGFVSRSDDGGENWNLPTMIPNDFYIHSSHFTSVMNGWVGGLGGKIFYTGNAGVNWEQQITPTESPIYGFYSVGKKLFAFGDHGTVLEFDGNGWIGVGSHDVSVYLRDMIVLSSGDLLLAGGSGSLFVLIDQPTEIHNLPQM